MGMILPQHWLTYFCVTDTVYLFIYFHSWATLMISMNIFVYLLSYYVLTNCMLQFKIHCWYGFICHICFLQLVGLRLIRGGVHKKGTGALVVVYELVCIDVSHNKWIEIILLTVWSGSLLTWLLNRRWDNSKQGKSKSYPPPTRCSFGKLYSGKWLFLRCVLCLQIIITFNVFDH